MTNTLFLSDDFFDPGSIKYMDINLSVDIDLINQLDALKEDLLQVNYFNNTILDVGWYPSFDESGIFQIRVVESYDWDNPVFYLEANSLVDLKISIQTAIDFILKKD